MLSKDDELYFLIRFRNNKKQQKNLQSKVWINQEEIWRKTGLSLMCEKVCCMFAVSPGVMKLTQYLFEVKKFCIQSKLMQQSPGPLLCSLTVIPPACAVDTIWCHPLQWILASSGFTFNCFANFTQCKTFACFSVVCLFCFSWSALFCFQIH